MVYQNWGSWHHHLGRSYHSPVLYWPWSTSLLSGVNLPINGLRTAESCPSELLLLLWLMFGRLGIRYVKRHKVLWCCNTGQFILLLIHHLGKLIVMSISQHLLLRFTENLSESAKILRLVLVSQLDMFLYQLLPLLLSVFSPFSCKHSLLQLSLSFPSDLSLPLLAYVE